MADFIWGQGGTRMTPDDIAAQRKVAQALMMQGVDYSPIQSPWQGAARMAQALMGGWQGGQADRAAGVNAAEDAALMQQYTGQAGTPLAAAPVSLPIASTAASSAPAVAGPMVPNDGNAAPGTVGMNQRLADLAYDFIDDNPGTSLSSGHRSTEDQARLYAQRGSNPNPVAFPGTSKHERGQAVDIGGMSPVARALLSQYGLAQPVPNDPPHVELAPATQLAAADPAALPVNASEAQGYVTPGQQAAPAPAARPPINAAILRGLGPYSSDATRKMATILFQNNLEAQQKASDPLRQLQIQQAQGQVAAMPVELQGKQLSNEKIRRELQGEGASALTPEERAGYGIPKDQPAYKTRSGEIKFGPAGTKITNNVGDAENSFAKEAGKVTANRFNDLVADGQKSKQMMSDMNTLLDLGKGIGTGKGAQLKAVLGPYANSAGINVDGLSDIQAYEAIVNRVAPSLRVAGSGAQSDYELKNFLKSIPSLGNTQEGNELATAVMTGLTQNKVQAAEISSRALAGEITRADAEKQLRDLPDPMQPYKEYKQRKSNVDDLLKKYGSK